MTEGTAASAGLLGVVRLAVACGACDAGGALTPQEIALVRDAGPASSPESRRMAARLRDGEDFLGDALLALRSTGERRRLGAFYTSAAVVDAMLDRLLEYKPKRIVDAGCGSGRFAVAAARRDLNLEIVAVDVDPAATLITRAALAVAGARRARVIHGDYLYAELPGTSGRTGFVGNPPYVRHHDLSPATKSRAAALAARLETRISGLAGLHALFYLATLALHARVGDCGAFVTSAEWLDVGYGATLRELFAGKLGGESLDAFDRRATPFADAMTTAVVASFRVGSRRAFARLAQIASPAHPFRLAKGHRVSRSRLLAEQRWSPLVANVTTAPHDSQIGSLFRVSRGQVTGNNAFFVMSRAQAHERGIGAFCVPLVARAKDVLGSRGLLRDAPDRMVGLEIPPGTDLREHRALAAYLRAGETRGVDKGYIVARRRPWYAIRFPKPPIVATYMARQAPYFARNPEGLGVLNIAHGLYPRVAMDECALERVVALLNDDRPTFVGRGRTYHGGLEKFEPREMERLPLAFAQ